MILCSFKYRRKYTIDEDQRVEESTAKDYVVQYSVNNDLLRKEVSVTNAEGPPVPIPNTEVKLCSGENTLRATARENNSMLTLDRESREICFPLVKKPSEKRKSLN